jgi:AraC-like DNA-binding protein
MSASLVEHIENTAAYIEKNIKNPLSLEQISEGVGVSKFYLNRIFSALTGQTLMNYVNRRKLVSSLHELLYTKMHIVDISEEYGFSFESAFIRSFKREFGITPDIFRKTKCEIPIIAPITSGVLSAIGESSILVKPVMMFKPAFFVTGDRCYTHSRNDVGGFTVDFDNRRQPLIKNIIDCRVSYQHRLYDSTNAYWYTVCAEVENDGLPPPEGMITFQIPESNYWVFKFIKTSDFHYIDPVNYTASEKCEIDSIHYISSAEYEYIFESAYKWFGITGEQDSSYSLGKTNFRILSESYFEMDFYFPVIEKKVI